MDEWQGERADPTTACGAGPVVAVTKTFVRTVLSSPGLPNRPGPATGPLKPAGSEACTPLLPVGAVARHPEGPREVAALAHF